jgi:WS/DGAT/MGAT family acyltransferase
MPGGHFERLSALDASFLGIEEPNARWHEGAVMVFEPGPLARPDGGIDVAKISQAYESLLNHVERYRQRLAYVPWFDHPVWVDDPSFNIRYHIRHISLPKPGDERILKRVCGYLLSLPLDQGKPLWEVWLVDGLENGHFALVNKAHHCMMDGAAGMNILAALLKPEADETVAKPMHWEPRPAPSGAKLFVDELTHRMTAPLDVLRPLRQPRAALRSAWNVATGIAEAASLGLKGVSDTLFNPEAIGPRRRFDWVSMDLADVKEVKNRLGGTVNDVVLATAAGALGEFMRSHDNSTDEMNFRALVPVSIRSKTEAQKLGNRVAMVMAPLPVRTTDPIERLEQVIETTRGLKESNQALGVQWLEEFADRVGGNLLLGIIRQATRARPFNVTVTNLRGPQFSLYMLGAKLQAIHPMVPLFANQALGIAVMSYDGKVHWGFNSDWDSLPDLHDLVTGVGVEFEAIKKAAAVRTPVRRHASTGQAQEAVSYF